MKPTQIRFVAPLIWLVLVACLPLGCLSNSSQPVLRLATTTSARDSGLLDVLLPEFERQHHCRVDVVAVGTGAALKLGESGDADAVLVHARPAELAFMKAGHGIRHEEFMFNEFILLGPPTDPAAIRDQEVVAALKAIADHQSLFLSRGDDSGTHRREQQLWAEAGISPQWPEYLESGQGMGATLTMADEKQAYVLADKGTYLNRRDKLSLVPLARSGELLYNPYALIVVNPDKHSQVQAELADALATFLIQPETQRSIGEFKLSGESLFTPTRLDDSH